MFMLSLVLIGTICEQEFVCVEVLRPSQPNGVMSSAVSLLNHTFTGQAKPASVAQLDAPSDWRPGGRRFNPRRGRQHSFGEIDHEIFSTAILSLPLIQEG